MRTPVNLDDRRVEEARRLTGTEERTALMGRGIGYADVHRLASVALSGTARLWTRHRRRAAVAMELDLAHPGKP